MEIFDFYLRALLDSIFFWLKRGRVILGKPLISTERTRFVPKKGGGHQTRQDQTRRNLAQSRRVAR